LQRYGSNNNLIDNFSNEYYTGTNKLKNLTGSGEQYNYDYNGNMTNDYFAENYGITYDHRNLITEITRVSGITYPPVTTKIRYKYDEAGNRTRKTIYQTQDEFPSPIISDDTPTGWTIILDEYYARDATGKEIAIYSSYTLQYWNVWSGGEITGRINYSESLGRNYYLKDHLGSIRVVLDEDKAIVSANDLDMWGYYLQDRTYSTSNTKNKFTGKERDQESSYDYFGARYYNSRIGNWTSIDPLFEKHIQWSPYNYVLRNPMILIDPDGKQIHFSENQDIRNEQVEKLRMTVNPKYGKNIDYTINSNGEYVLDIASLNETQHSKVTDRNFTRLMTIANSNEPVSYFFVEYNEKFDFKDPQFSNLQETSFESLEKENLVILGGYTFVSGNITNDENPKYTSGTAESRAMINMKYGSKESVVSLAHELYVHIYNYILGQKWTHLGDVSGDIKKQVNQVETKTKENYNEWIK